MSFRSAIAAIAAGGLFLVSGCATVPVDSARRDTQRLLQPGLANQSAASEQELQALLAKPLDAGTAVRVALLRNPAIQTEYAQLGIAAAEVFEASRLANPRLGLSLLWPRLRGDDRKIDGELGFGLTDLLRLGASRRSGKAGFEAAKLRAAAAVYNLALDVQSAWLDAIAAEQRRSARANIAESAELSSELATQYHAAGNINALSLALHQAAGSEASIEASRAASNASRARARLRQALGLRAGDSAFVLPVTLPSPDAGEFDRAALLASARAQRLDLAAANEQIRALETRLASARRLAWLGDSELGAVAERDGNAATRRGASLGLPLPLFHQGQGHIARANAELQIAVAGRQQLETMLDAELDTQLEQLAESRRQYALYRERLIPQREAAVARLSEQANFMLASPFELLVARQQEYSAYEGAIEALHDYWQNRIELTRAAGASLPTLNTETRP